MNGPDTPDLNPNPKLQNLHTGDTESEPKADLSDAGNLPEPVAPEADLPAAETDLPVADDLPVAKTVAGDLPVAKADWWGLTAVDTNPPVAEPDFIAVAEAALPAAEPDLMPVPEAALPVAEPDFIAVPEAALPAAEPDLMPVPEAALPAAEPDLMPVPEAALPAAEPDLMPVPEAALPAAEPDLMPVPEAALPLAEPDLMPVADARLPVEEADLLLLRRLAEAGFSVPEADLMPVPEAAFTAAEPDFMPVPEAAFTAAEPDFMPVPEAALPAAEPDFVPVAEAALPAAEPDLMPVAEAALPAAEPDFMPVPETALPAAEPDFMPVPETALPAAEPDFMPVPETALPAAEPDFMPVPETALPAAEPDFMPVPETALPAAEPDLMPVPETALPAAEPDLMPAPEEALPAAEPDFVPVPEAALPAAEPDFVPVPEAALPAAEPDSSPVPEAALPDAEPDLSSIPEAAFPTVEPNLPLVPKDDLVAEVAAELAAELSELPLWLRETAEQVQLKSEPGNPFAQLLKRTRSVWITGTNIPAFSQEGFQAERVEEQPPSIESETTDSESGMDQPVQNDFGDFTDVLAGIKAGTEPAKPPKPPPFGFVRTRPVASSTGTFASLEPNRSPVVKVVKFESGAGVASSDEANELLSKAKLNFDRGQFDSSLIDYERALNYYDHQLDPQTESVCSCLADLIDVYMFLGRPQDALAASRRLHDIDRARKRDKNHIILLMKTASACEGQGNYAAAKEAYLEAIALADELLPPEDPLHARLSKSFADVHRKPQPQSDSTYTQEVAALVEPKRSSPPKASAQTKTTEHTYFKGAELTEGRQSVSSTSEFVPSDARTKLAQILHSPLMHTVPVMFVTVVLVFILVIGTISSLRADRAGRLVPAAGATKTGVENQYKSCDNRKIVEIVSASECRILDHGRSSRAEYKALNGSWSDLKSMFFGCMRNTPELWLQIDDAGFIDQDGTHLYKPDAGELAVAEKMWWYAEFAATQYRPNKIYPFGTAKYLNLPAFHYSNPFTGKGDYAEILFKGFAAADKSWSQKVKAGMKWDGEGPWRAGAIHCICLDYCRFFIRGFDRHDQPLTSSEPGQDFDIELLDGVNVTAGELKTSATKESGRGSNQLHVFISSSPGMGIMVAVARQLIPAFLWCWGIASCVWLLGWLSLRDRKGASTNILFSSLSFICTICLLGGWYFMAVAWQW